MASIFDRLAEILSQQTSPPSPPSPPSEVLASLGAGTTSIAILDRGTATTHCISQPGTDCDADTLFQACSISKPVAAVAVARLVDADKLSFDSKLFHLLPEHIKSSIGPKELLQDITVKQLLSHRAGLNCSGYAGYPASSRDGSLPELEQVILGRPGVNSLPLRLISLLGRGFRYSGGGFVLMQLILEIMEGKPFAQLVQEQVFGPLDMRRSCYTLKQGEKNHAKASYNGVTKCEEEFNVLPEQAAGGLWTTPSDLLKVIHALQTSLEQPHDGESGHHEATSARSQAFLRRETVREMMTELEGSSFGIGWSLRRPDGNVFCHSGQNFPGFGCHVAGFADVTLGGQGKGANAGEIVPESGICVMTDSLEGIQVYHPLIQALAYLKGWPDMGRFAMGEAISVPLPLPEVGDTDGKARGWKPWEGSWSNEENTEQWQISGSNGSPTARFGSLAARTLQPVAMSPRRYEQGRSVDLVMEGVRMMLRLGWDEETGEEAVDVWDGLTGQATRLQRVR